MKTRSQKGRPGSPLLVIGTRPEEMYPTAVRAANELADRISRMERELEELRRFRAETLVTEHLLSQELAKSLAGRYPWYKDDQRNFPGATEADGVCTGDSTLESLVAEVVVEVARLRKAVLDAYSDVAVEVGGLRADRDRLIEELESEKGRQ
jgi:hypothetical protein